MATVVGVFESKDSAERAVRQMRDQGFRNNEISIVAKDEGRGGQGGRRGQGAFGTEAAGEDFGTQTVADGTAWGGALGALGGLLAGAGALAIPGIGPIVAAGPLAATLSGAVAGGVAGGLLDMGVPEERGRQLEEEVRRGRVLCVVEAAGEKATRAEEILEHHGARQVEVHQDGGQREG